MIRQDGGDVAHEAVQTQTGDRRDGVKGEPLPRAEAFQLETALFGAGQLRLAARDDLRMSRQFARVRGELTLDHAPVLDGVTAATRIEIDEMHENARALRMAQETVPESLAIRSARAFSCISSISMRVAAVTPSRTGA